MGFAPHTRRGAPCMGAWDRSRPYGIGCAIDTCRCRQDGGRKLMPLPLGVDHSWLRRCVSTVSPRHGLECDVSGTGTHARFGEQHGIHCRCTRVWEYPLPSPLRDGVEGVSGRVGGSRVSVATEYSWGSVFPLWALAAPRCVSGCVLVARRVGRGLGLGRSPRVRASGSELLDDG